VWPNHKLHIIPVFGLSNPMLRLKAVLYPERQVRQSFKVANLEISNGIGLFIGGVPLPAKVRRCYTIPYSMLCFSFIYRCFLPLQDLSALWQGRFIPHASYLRILRFPLERITSQDICRRPTFSTVRSFCKLGVWSFRVLSKPESFFITQL
jgi:hypothetical protein